MGARFPLAGIGTGLIENRETRGKRMEENMSLIRVVARPSPLSLQQVKEVFLELGNVPYEVLPVWSYGDKHKEISLMEQVPEDFFTRELDTVLLEGRADVAIHSAKDLPFPLPEGIELAALTRGKTPTDALVSKHHLSLCELPPHAKIGVSSVSRKEHLLRLRSDVEIVPIRGTIEERISLVEKGEVDAIVVATCALERLGLEGLIAEELPFETHPLQGKLAVTIKKGRPDLMRLFSPIDERYRYGRVYLVGAGPGAKELLTIKACHCLSYADVVLYDDLVGEGVMDMVRYAREKIYVGKRAGRHTMDQKTICSLLARYAYEGKRVVRLKGGDPLVFGRAQEEIEYLLRRHIPVEVINGISSAFAAAADLGISLTNRVCGSQMILESGHLQGEEHQEKVSCHVFYMGANSKREIYEKMKKSYALDTPVIVIQYASLPWEVVEKRTLGQLPESRLSSPLVILVGDVGRYYWPQSRVLYTGIDPFETLSNVPAKWVHYPLITRERIKDLPEIEDQEYDGLVFTSSFAVDVWTDFYGVRRKRVYAIGPRTRQRLLERGYEHVIIPEKYDSYALHEQIEKDGTSMRLFYPCSSLSSNVLTKQPKIIPFPVYRTISLKQPKLDLTQFEGVYFASGSCVDAFFQIYERIPQHLVLYVGGRVTYEKLATMGEGFRTILLEKQMSE